MLSIAQVNAQKGINFFQGSFDEALNEAKIQGKLIFVDAYAEWCGPCKNMAATVFKEETVGNYYNSKFYQYENLIWKKAKVPALARKYQVRAYPSFFY